MKWSVLITLIALGCTSAPIQPTVTADDGATTEIEMPDTSELVGTTPDEALLVPEFDAINWDGEPRDSQALLGHPTVLWFFPFSNTPG